MVTEKLYKYLGLNGVITSPVLLENIYSVKMLKLIADDGKLLTKDNKTFYQNIVIPEIDLDKWVEIKNN